MKEEIKLLKEALRIIDARYVMSEQTDDYAIIRFNHKDRNYKLHINHQYKFMVLEQTDSLKGVFIGEDTIGLLEDIRTIKNSLSLENYNVFALASSEKKTSEGLEKILEITYEVNNIDIVSSCEMLDATIQYREGSIFSYNCGLNSFDERIFSGAWLEDFNSTLFTCNEEDLYIMFTTLVSYFYKLSENKWEGYIIDPYVISDVLEMLLNEIKRREKDINAWLNMWSEYFDSLTIEKYLKQKEKTKGKH